MIIMSTTKLLDYPIPSRLSNGRLRPQVTKIRVFATMRLVRSLDIFQVFPSKFVSAKTHFQWFKSIFYVSTQTIEIGALRQYSSVRSKGLPIPMTFGRQCTQQSRKYQVPWQKVPIGTDSSMSRGLSRPGFITQIG